MRRLTFLLPLIIFMLAACGDSGPELIPTPAGPATAPTAGLSNGATVQPVQFTADDGAPLAGSYYAGGPTAIVIARNTYESHGPWHNFAAQLAGRGYSVLLYDFRGMGDSRGALREDQLDSDLRGALDFVRSEGASKIVLIGATMGGPPAAKIAAQEAFAAVVFLSPGSTGTKAVVPRDSDLAAIAAPKLFLTSAGDRYKEQTLKWFAATPDPKEQEVYPGDNNASTLFLDHRDAAVARMIAFLDRYAPPR